MKKLIYIIAAVGVFIFSSCTQECHDCDCAGVHDKVCRNEYDTQEEYEDALDTNESLGCNCSVE